MKVKGEHPPADMAGGRFVALPKVWLKKSHSNRFNLCMEDKI